MMGTLFTSVSGIAILSLLGCQASGDAADGAVEWLTKHSVHGVEAGIVYNDEPSMIMARLKLREEVVDISPLQRLSGLEYLSVSGTRVTDLGPIVSLPHLQFLNIADTPVETVEVLDVPRRAPLVILYRKSTAKLEFGPDGGIEHLRPIDLESPCEQARQRACEEGAMPWERLQSTRVLDEVPVLVDDAHPERGTIAFIRCADFLDAEEH